MMHIQGATIIDPATGESFVGDLDTEEGKIVRLEKTGDADLSFLCENNTSYNNDLDSCSQPQGTRKILSGQEAVIDARGLIMTAGLVDAHAHFRDPGQTEKEEIRTGAEAAKHGGYTSVIMMGNTIPHPDTPEVIEYMIKKGSETGIHVYASANVTRGMQGKELTDMKALKEAGAVLFTDDGLPIIDEDLFRRACAQAASLGMMISLHEEDPRFVYDAGVNEGPVALLLGLRGASRDAEIKLTKRDIKIAAEEGADIMIQHISCAETVELVREARRTHQNIHAEATPHHFTLTQEAVLSHGTLAKMNPPLRTEADRQAIIRGLADGTIEQIATDHAPHTAEEKAREFKKAPSGIIGLETALGLGIRELVQTGELSMQQLLAAMSASPARLSGIHGGKIAEGEPADLLLFDPRGSYTAEHFFSKATNTPFEGEKLTGRIEAVVACGKLVFERQ